eukprot:2959602-Amphidinium_carterae.1
MYWEQLPHGLPSLRHPHVEVSLLVGHTIETKGEPKARCCQKLMFKYALDLDTLHTESALHL